MPSLNQLVVKTDGFTMSGSDNIFKIMLSNGSQEEVVEIRAGRREWAWDEPKKLLVERYLNVGFPSYQDCTKLLSFAFLLDDDVSKVNRIDPETPKDQFMLVDEWNVATNNFADIILTKNGDTVEQKRDIDADVKNKENTHTIGHVTVTAMGPALNLEDLSGETDGFQEQLTTNVKNQWNKEIYILARLLRFGPSADENVTNSIPVITEFNTPNNKDKFKVTTVMKGATNEDGQLRLNVSSEVTTETSGGRFIVNHTIPVEELSEDEKKLLDDYQTELLGNVRKQWGEGLARLNIGQDDASIASAKDTSNAVTTDFNTPNSKDKFTMTTEMNGAATTSTGQLNLLLISTFHGAFNGASDSPNHLERFKVHHILNMGDARRSKHKLERVATHLQKSPAFLCMASVVSYIYWLLKLSVGISEDALDCIITDACQALTKVCNGSDGEDYEIGKLRFVKYPNKIDDVFFRLGYAGSISKQSVYCSVTCPPLEKTDQHGVRTTLLPLLYHATIPTRNIHQDLMSFAKCLDGESVEVVVEPMALLRIVQEMFSVKAYLNNNIYLFMDTTKPDCFIEKREVTVEIYTVDKPDKQDRELLCKLTVKRENKFKVGELSADEKKLWDNFRKELMEKVQTEWSKHEKVRPAVDWYSPVETVFNPESEGRKFNVTTTITSAAQIGVGQEAQTQLTVTSELANDSSVKFRVVHKLCVV
eukprot:GHVS01057365.1.p1 GENE.GHVS01057365.1~~GHVS01057365.1.p1  ORF type:complete len:705 (-),score=74.12 GHVS01057365.1:185-2299(-)